MALHVIDMIMLQNNVVTAEMHDILNDTNRLQKHLDVEAALVPSKKIGGVGVRARVVFPVHGVSMYLS